MKKCIANAITTLLIVCGIATLSVCGVRALDAAPVELASENWSVSASPNLARKPPSEWTVDSFVRALELSLWGEATVGQGDEVCSYTFANLRHNGSLSLVFGLGVAGRPSCQDIYIVDKTSAGFEIYSGGGEIGAGSVLPEAVEDLRHDGKLELVIVTDMGTIAQCCHAEWTAIYAWTGANYTNVSDEFKDLYRQRLDTIKRIIPALQPVPGPTKYTLREKKCLEAEAAALKRFLGISPDAGTDQAMSLAISKDPAEREFATELLAQIGSPKAREYLSKLATDKDRNVADAAKNGLSRSAMGAAKIALPEFTPLAIIKHFR